MILLFQRIFAVLSVLLLTAGTFAEDSAQEVEALKKDIAELQKRLATANSSTGASKVDRALESKYGPNSTVTTRHGKLIISGMVQVWYYSIQNDNEALFQDADINGVSDTNEASDNDSFRVRRTEMKFNLDIHENISAVVMMDPAREATSFPTLPSNQGIFKRQNNVAPGVGLTGSTGVVSNVQNGSGAVPRLLQDAYINYHGVVPHHDFQIGQFKPWFGDEGIRSSAQLDFVERSFIGQIGDARDLGVSVHGTWVSDRVQYWFGIFNGTGSFLQSAGQAQNRSDDNDAKDFNARILYRPFWKYQTWGSMELGYSVQAGIHGEASGRDPVDTPLNGLNRNEVSAIRHAAWASYMPGGPVQGWWLRGEWASFRDRHAPRAVVDLTGNGNTVASAQTNMKPITVQGWYFSTGYKIMDSCFKDDAPSWLRPFEFAFRYETFDNVQVADLLTSSQTDVFKTQVWTAGINYYIQGHNAKIQFNYNVVDEPEGDDNAGNRTFHGVRNDNFVVNFQVAF